MGKKDQLRSANRSGSYYRRNYGKKKVEPVSVMTGKMKVGKFKGVLLSEVPTSYLDWMVVQTNFSMTGIALILQELKKRLENRK
jgi:uncharacterized protein (DUF3820 family)